MSLEETERECAEGRSAPRVSLDDIRAEIASEHYFVAWDALFALDTLSDAEPRPAENQLATLTICLLVLKNGWVQLGKSAPADPANFNSLLGRKLAYEDAVRGLWPLMGFALKNRLAKDDEP